MDPKDVINTTSKRIATRDAYGDELVDLGRDIPQIIVIDADIGKSCKTTEFAKTYPDKHINVGIAEQSAACIAAGLALCGKIPFITTYAVFGSMRMLEMLRQTACYDKLNVKIACSHGGLTPANDGASHQCVEDMGILRTLPNMTIVMGADYYSMRKLIRAAVEYPGPVYLRMTRDPVDILYTPDDMFKIGKAVTIRDGKDITFIANGDMVALALKSARELAEDAIDARVIDMHTIKPLDEEVVEKALLETKNVITIEDHNIFCGLGSAVCEIAAYLGKGRVWRMGVQDKFGQSGPYEQLLIDNGISVHEIMVNARKMLLRT